MGQLILGRKIEDKSNHTIPDPLKPIEKTGFLKAYFSLEEVKEMMQERENPLASIINNIKK